MPRTEFAVEAASVPEIRFPSAVPDRELLSPSQIPVARPSVAHADICPRQSRAVLILRVPEPRESPIPLASPDCSHRTSMYVQMHAGGKSKRNRTPHPTSTRPQPGPTRRSTLLPARPCPARLRTDALPEMFRCDTSPSALRPTQTAFPSADTRPRRSAVNPPEERELRLRTESAP